MRRQAGEGTLWRIGTDVIGQGSWAKRHPPNVNRRAPESIMEFWFFLE